MSEDKIFALEEYATSPLYSDEEYIAFEYAHAITLCARNVEDELFSRLRRY